VDFGLWNSARAYLSYIRESSLPVPGRIEAQRPWLRPARLCVCVGVHFLDNWKAKLVLKQNCIQYKADLFDLFILIYTLKHNTLKHTHTYFHLLEMHLSS